ncbi:calcium-binding protein, partial [bacterium]|nr:calcium-binding protein [bacterium]
MIDSPGDVIVEEASGGNDTVKVSTSYTLSGNIENLTLTGTDAVNGTGSGVANILTGNSAANILDGGAGDDRLIGGEGDDTYRVDSTLDTVVELAGQGTDTVQASVTYSLSANVENLTLTGTAIISGT